MPSELSPAGSGAKMTKAQIVKYIKDMKKAQKVAQIKLEEAKKRGDFKKEETEVARLAELLNDDNLYS